jgi:hypothetical protein
MTAFFVPGAPPGAPTRQAYAELLGYVEAQTGHGMREDVICALSCRRSGQDSEIRVGEPDPISDQVVLAIFAGRESYTIVWSGGHAEVSRRQTYEAIPFD